MKIKGVLRKKMEKPKFTYPKLFIKEPKQFITLPSTKDLSKIDMKYPLLEPFAYAHIKWSKIDNKLIYNIIEPALTEEDKKVFEKIKESLTELIDVKMSVIKNTEEAITYIEKKVNKIMEATKMNITSDMYVRVMYYLLRDFVGLNDIEPIMHDPYIEDIGCTGADAYVYVVHRKFGSLETNIVYNDMEKLTNYVIKLSEKCNRYISYARPILDGTLPDGSRVQASIAKDVTTKGPTFSIRKFRKHPYSPVDMIMLNTASSSLLAYMWFLLENNISILVCGGVSTGKTTMLNVLSMFIRPEKKIVSIEDTREINISHENWIPSVARTGFGMPEASGKRYGEVDMFDLLKESFRMNPDYIIVGEIRGKEAYVMFQGMSSGHPSLGTMHAGSIDDVIKRLESPPIELSTTLIESLDILIVMTRSTTKERSVRKVKDVLEIQSIDSKTGNAHAIRTFNWIPSADTFKDNSNNSEILRRISFETGVPYQDIMKEIKARKSILEWMQRNEIIQFSDVSNIINLYYKEPKTVLKWVEKNTMPNKSQLEAKLKKRWQSSTDLEVISD